MLEGRIVTAGVMLAIFVTAVAIALIYFSAGARTLPLVIGIPGIILTGIQFLTELRQKEGKKISEEIRRGEVRMVIWFLIFVIGLVAFGFVIVSPILIAVYMLIGAREKWYTALIGAAIALIVMEFVFQRGIGIVLFEGLITPYFYGY